MAGQARVRISIGVGELEVEGTEDFVKEYSDSISALIEKLNTTPIKTADAQVPTTSQSTQPPPPTEQKEFGEVLHSLPSGASGSDQMLVAASHAQAASGDNTFSTNEANSLLLEQGVKLSNPSQSLKNAIAAKRVFKVGKRYRLSKTGEDYLKSVVG